MTSKNSATPDLELENSYLKAENAALKEEILVLQTELAVRKAEPELSAGFEEGLKNINAHK